MAAVLGLDDEAVETLCTAAAGGGVAEAVNFNSPGQVVVAGDSRAIGRLVELAKDAGARRAMLLPVSVPAHSSLMRPAGEALAHDLDAAVFNAPEIPVICAVDGKPYGDGEDVRRRMKQQVDSPVRWVATINHMLGHGVTSIVECGPGRVLSGLIKRIDRSIATSCVDSADALKETITGALQ